MKIHIQTFGCKLNRYESEKLSYELKNLGLTITELALANYVVINTCTVTKDSDKKLIAYIENIEDIENKHIFLIGCYATKNKNEYTLKNNITLITNEEKDIASEIILSKIKNTKENVLKTQETPIFIPQEQSRAFLKIQDGCIVFCSYCIVARVRGKSKSESIEKIHSAVDMAYKNGYKEIVLTGLNLGSYQYEDTSFVYMLQSVMDKCEKLNMRVRISSVEPIHFDKGLINLFKKENSKILTPHAHIPLQSGSDKILQLMNRRYSQKDFLNITEALYKANPNISITTDIMVGFPEESDKDFSDTVETAKKSNFLKMHVFRYSNRENTPSYSMDGQVGYRTKIKRSKILTTLNKELKAEHYKNSIGKTVDIIIEKEISQNIYEGTSGEYLFVQVKSNIELAKKMLITAKIESIENNMLIAVQKI